MSADILSRVYYDPKDPGSLGRVYRLLQREKQLCIKNVTQNSVQKYLRSEQAYTLHKPARHRLTSNQTYGAGIDAQWQVDLADMQGIARQNGAINYLITVIGVFSKFSWALPGYSKTAKLSRRPSGKCSQRQNPRHPKRLQTDKGQKFFN